MRLLVALDGSKLSQRAVAVAETIAGRDGSIVLFHAHWPGLPTDEADALIQSEAVRLRDLGIRAEAERRATPRDEETGRVIVEAARDREVDLIVLTTHGRSGIGRWLFGSVAEQVIRTAECSILLLPTDLPADWPAGRQPCVLLAVDPSELAAQAVSPTVALARSLGAEIVVVEVAPDGDRGVVSDAEARLQALVDRIRESGVSARSVVCHGDPARSIAALAGELEVSAIGMGTHSSDTERTASLGSVAMSMVRRVDVPILLGRGVGR